jgi:hypothetical protein
VKNLKKLLIALFVLAFVLSAAGDVFSASYEGSLDDDTMYIGNIAKIDRDSRVITLKTRFEKNPKTRTLHMLDNCIIQVNTTKDPAEKGAYKKFVELKEGTLVVVYGWPKDGKWWARRIDITNPDGYLPKRLEADNKVGVYFGHNK